MHLWDFRFNYKFSFKKAYYTCKSIPLQAIKQFTRKDEKPFNSFSITYRFLCSLRALPTPYTCAFLWPMVNERTTCIRAPTNALPFSLVFCFDRSYSHVNIEHTGETHIWPTHTHTIITTTWTIRGFDFVYSFVATLSVPLTTPLTLLLLLLLL